MSIYMVAFRGGMPLGSLGLNLGPTNGTGGFDNPLAGGTLTMMPADRSWRAQTEWPTGSATLQAPGNFPIKDGRTYLADFGGKPVAVTLTQIPPKVTGARMQAAWMLEKGCVAQAEALLKTTQ